MNYMEQFNPEESAPHLLLESRAAEAPDATFFTFADEVWSFSDFNTAANCLARNLARKGIGKGTHVFVLMDTSSDLMLLWFALSKLGAVEVSVNTAYHGDLLRHLLKISQATVCVFDSRFDSVIREVSDNLAMFDQTIVRGSNGGAATDFAGLRMAGEDGNLDVPLAQGDITGIIFTSGTTGPSKGVMLSYRYLTAYGLMYAEINGLKDDDVVLNFLPFFHIAAKFLTIATLACKGRMRLQGRLSISTFWDEVRAHGVTNFLGVGGVCNMLVSRPPRPDDGDTSIRTIYAVPDPADIHLELEERFGCQITTVFGSTEAGLPIFRGVGDDYAPRACGRVSPYYEVMIADENDNPVPVGKTGDILVRPKYPYLVGSGYIGMPQQTIEAWRNLWLHTGDRGHLSEDGWYYFDDRSSDSLRRRGENISSFEVETLVSKHPSVSEAVVVAGPSEVGEDEVRVLVVLREGKSLVPEELLEFCYGQMPYFMVPRFIDIVQDVPRTATAKVEKYKIRLAGLTEATWDCNAHGWKVTRDRLERPN